MTSSTIVCSDTHFEDRVSLAIVDAVAERRDVDPVDLPPLYEWIEPDALNGLFDPATRGGCNCRLEFTYAGCTVVVERSPTLSIVVDGEETVSVLEFATPQTEA
ncbi:HalOD1 output domain-containing protein [Natrarchaeobius chitinivorans]|uniref:Halobacterial output domain-containing protein n=1 Tax=Natrarchaeobius chitinivorans TaxID=1679083 RepID=A0A3N6M7V4_NATCH|nr:HalOD1 output domain-containing protein [Natrarchaeobius chitinivorans]RQG92250.1 hypothetical protein EA473_17220 [Natrarchaeobius chitinivorans]